MNMDTLYPHIKNIYTHIKSMMKKGELLKYLKKNIHVGSRREFWNSKGLTIKVFVEGTSMDVEAGGLAKNLQIASYVRKSKEEKEKICEGYVARSRMKSVQFGSV